MRHLLPLLALLLIACAAPAAPAAANTYTNPVFAEDFPDPDVIQVSDTYYAYATNAGTTNVQVARSTDLVHWARSADALPARAAWAKPDFGFTWAPAVATFDGGATYTMFYVARSALYDRQCIGRATASAPAGPFIDAAAVPFICHPTEGGDIDPAIFHDDDGTFYLIWKNDGNCCGMDTWLFIQPLAPDGAGLTGTQTRILKQDQPWEGSLIEGPTLWRQDGRYYLFYSANDYTTDRYGIGYAVANAPTGPYTKAPGPWASSKTAQGQINGPGGQDIITGPSGRTFLLYHAWDADYTRRRLHVDELRWQNGAPAVTLTAGVPQPMP